MAFDDKLYKPETAKAALVSFVDLLKSCASDPAKAVISKDHTSVRSPGLSFFQHLGVLLGFFAVVVDFDSNASLASSTPPPPLRSCSQQTDGGHVVNLGAAGAARRPGPLTPLARDGGVHRRRVGAVAGPPHDGGGRLPCGHVVSCCVKTKLREGKWQARIMVDETASCTCAIEVQGTCT